jgi:hypothetical protein
MFSPARIFQPQTGEGSLIERRRLRLRQSPLRKWRFCFQAARE